MSVFDRAERLRRGQPRQERPQEPAPAPVPREWRPCLSGHDWAPLQRARARYKCTRCGVVGHKYDSRRRDVLPGTTNVAVPIPYVCPKCHGPTTRWRGTTGGLPCPACRAARGEPAGGATRP